MAHSLEKVGGSSRFSCLFTCFLWLTMDCSDRADEKIVSHSDIYVFGPVFVKTTNDFNLNIYRLDVYLRL